MIIVYSKDSCPQCIDFTYKMEVKGLAYEVLHLGRDYEMDDIFSMIENSIRTDFCPKGFPVVVINGNPMSYDESLKVLTSGTE